MESQDIFVEVSHGPTLIDNNVMLSRVSLRFATQGVALVHNLMCGTFTCVGGGTGTRYTPYHIRHRTEVAGFMHFLHGDNRFYNNIFIQGISKQPDPRRGEPNEKERICGTWQFDGYPTYDEWISWFDMDVERPDMGKLARYHESHLPVWARGNVYLGGAKPWQHETDCLVIDEAPSISLTGAEDAVALNTDVYELIADFRAGMVNSDILGAAFEPEQRFESPDGSAIVFDRDYLGNTRGVGVLPGPFASAEAAKKPLW